ncbi:MAG: M4 family peptidase, partial [Moraxellaceae bacterium]
MQRQILSNPKVATVEISTSRQTPAFISCKREGGSITKADAPVFLTQALGIRAGIDYLIPGKSLYNQNGIEVIQYQQFFKGVQVDHAAVKALVKDGKISFFTTDWLNIPAGISVQPTLSSAQALTYAKSVVKAQKYAWEAVEEAITKTTDPLAKAALQKKRDEYLPKRELVIVQDYTKGGIAEAKLAYRFNMYAAEPLSRSWVYIDAHNGKLLLLDKIIKHADDPAKKQSVTSVNATVATRYAGTQLIKTKQVSGNDPNSGLPLISSHPTSEPLYLPGSSTYVLIDDSKGGGIETYDLNNIGGLPISVPGLTAQAKSFTDVDNNWTAAEHRRSPAIDGAAEAENDDIAFDAHWGASVVYDYWLAKHNRLSFDGNNAKIKSFIHYGPAYDNAFWDGSVMTYGDGSGPTAGGFHALTALDVCGHEIGHGVCSFTSDLLYQSESGAMNEALSDIWAACIEHFAMTRSGSTVPSTAYRPFYIGEQIGASYDAPLRRLDNPKQQGNPDTYGGTNWQDPNCTPTLVNDQCGVHTNSGVLNKWFFLLTAGSKNGTRPAGMTANQYYFADSDDEINDLNNVYRVDGVGFDLSEDIAFLMETMLTSSATYAQARTASIAAATTLSADPCSDA